MNSHAQVVAERIEYMYGVLDRLQTVDDHSKALWSTDEGMICYDERVTPNGKECLVKYFNDKFDRKVREIRKSIKKQPSEWPDWRITNELEKAAFRWVPMKYIEF